MTMRSTCGVLWWQACNDAESIELEYDDKHYSLKQTEPGIWTLKYHHERGGIYPKATYRVNDSRMALNAAIKRITE